MQRSGAADGPRHLAPDARPAPHPRRPCDAAAHVFLAIRASTLASPPPATPGFGRPSTWQANQLRGPQKETEMLTINRQPMDRCERIVERLLDTPADQRRLVLMSAFQTGELRLSEANDVVRMVARLETFCSSRFVTSR
jgi:hypothetical protein